MLLFLDVDGTLLPFGAARPYPVYDTAFALPEAAAGHPLLTRVDPALGCELVSVTTWMDDANACLAPWLGLPDQDDGDDDSAGPAGLHWKTRPFIWVDDEITDIDRTCTPGGPCCIASTTDADFAVLDG